MTPAVEALVQMPLEEYVELDNDSDTSEPRQTTASQLESEPTCESTLKANTSSLTIVGASEDLSKTSNVSDCAVYPGVHTGSSTTIHVSADAITNEEDDDDDKEENMMEHSSVAIPTTKSHWLRLKRRYGLAKQPNGQLQSDEDSQQYEGPQTRAATARAKNKHSAEEPTKKSTTDSEEDSTYDNDKSSDNHEPGKRFGQLRSEALANRQNMINNKPRFSMSAKEKRQMYGFTGGSSLPPLQTASAKRPDPHSPVMVGNYKEFEKLHRKTAHKPQEDVDFSAVYVPTDPTYSESVSAMLGPKQTLSNEADPVRCVGRGEEDSWMQLTRYPCVIRINVRLDEDYLREQLVLRLQAHGFCAVEHRPKKRPTTTRRKKTSAVRLNLI